MEFTEVRDCEPAARGGTGGARKTTWRVKQYKGKLRFSVPGGDTRRFLRGKSLMTANGAVTGILAANAKFPGCFYRIRKNDTQAPIDVTVERELLDSWTEDYQDVRLEPVVVKGSTVDDCYAVVNAAAAAAEAEVTV